jgi:CO/xanthine dehydrogenase Mo-binding subunit
MVARALPGPYTFVNYRAKHCMVATNKTPLGPYRGVGRPGACFAIERIVDEVARAVGRDPVEVRTENIVRSEEMPFPPEFPSGHPRADRPLPKPPRSSLHCGSAWFRSGSTSLTSMRS